MFKKNVIPGDKEGEPVRQTFDINWGTVLAVGIPLIIGGFNAYSNLADRITVLDTRGKARMESSDQFQAETKAQLQAVADLPLRVKAVEEQQKFLSDRLERIADLVRSGQDQLRLDLAAAIEPVRKDVAAVSTKIEVLADRVGPRKGDRIAAPGEWRPR